MSKSTLDLILRIDQIGVAFDKFAGLSQDG